MVFDLFVANIQLINGAAYSSIEFRSQYCEGKKLNIIAAEGVTLERA
jgi:hypothetical protein